MTLTDQEFAENTRRSGADVNRRWQEILKDHIAWRRDDHWNGDKSWRAALFLARGKQWSEDIQESDELNFASDLIGNQVTVPFISTHIEDMIGFLTQSDPYFAAQARREEDVDSAEVQEALLNYRWREGEFDDEYAMALRNLVTIGHCVAGTGISFQQDLDDAVPEAGTAGDTLEYDDTLRPGAPYLRNINPFLFYFDRWSPSKTLRDARWCAELFVRPIDDVIQDKNYAASVRKKMRSQDPDHQVMTFQEWRNINDPYATNAPADDQASRLGVFAKLYDKRYRLFRILGLGMETPLLEDAWPYPWLDGFPYIKRDFVRVPNELYGIGFVHYAAHVQLMFNRVRSKMAEHAKKHNAKYQHHSVAPDQLKIFENDEHGSIIDVGSGGGITPIIKPQLGEDLYRISQIFENDMRRLMGQDQLAAGANLPARTSAEEVRTRNRLFGAKLQEIVRSAEKLLRDAARQTLQHIKSNPPIDEVVRVAGRRGVRWVQLGHDDIAAEIDVDVRSVAREQIDPVTKRQQGLELMQHLTTMLPQALQVQQMQMQLGQPVVPIQIDLNVVMKYVFSNFEDPALERAFPEKEAEPITMPPPQPGAPTGAAPPAAPTQDATQSAQQSARPQPGV